VAYKVGTRVPVIEMVKGVKALGMETCMTLGMLTPEQAQQLADAGLDYYNHNIDTSERHYDSIVDTRTFVEHPESVPINMLFPIEGTPLANAAPIDPISFVRTVALARILMPMSDVRLSAGRIAMTDEMQALCFMAGANSTLSAIHS
jgi:biotin synthase